MKDKLLYYSPNDIPVLLNGEPDSTRNLQLRITQHELAGLKSLGSVIRQELTYIAVSHPTLTFAYFNRVVQLSMSAPELKNLISLMGKEGANSYVLTPFTYPVDAERILLESGAVHTLSSMVLAKELGEIMQIPDTKYRVEHLSPDTDGQEAAVGLFASFFEKPGESREQLRARFQHNLRNGPHVLISDDDRLIAITGAVVFGDVASIYAGIIDPMYRFTNASDVISISIMNELIRRGVNLAYMKSRNKGLVGYAQRYYGFRHLYSERVYECQ